MRAISVSLLVALAGCNSSNATTDLGPGMGMDLTAPTATITEHGTVTDLQSKKPIANLQICLFSPMLSPQPCATTAADGTYTLPGIPASTQVAASIKGGAYYPTLYLKTTGAADETYDLQAIASGTITLLAAVVNVQADDTKGDIAFIALDGNPPPDGGTGPAHNSGIAVALSPSSGSGPFYLAANGIPQMVNQQTVTSTQGVGTYINVDPGVVELTYTPPAGVTCSTPIAGWPGSTPSSIKALVAAGYGTAAYMTCK
jgi:hypothetical protein